MDTATTIKAALLTAGFPYSPCGLNADWSVEAWHLSEGEPNITSGDLYLLSDEGNDPDRYSVARRFYDDMNGNDEIDILASDLSLDQALAVAKWA